MSDRPAEDSPVMDEHWYRPPQAADYVSASDYADSIEKEREADRSFGCHCTYVADMNDQDVLLPESRETCPTHGVRFTDDVRRLRTCVEAWPDCETGLYNPACCRFPKSCSCTIWDPQYVTEADLEPARTDGSLSDGR